MAHSQPALHRACRRFCGVVVFPPPASWPETVRRLLRRQEQGTHDGTPGYPAGGRVRRVLSFAENAPCPAIGKDFQKTEEVRPPYRPPKAARADGPLARLGQREPLQLGHAAAGDLRRRGRGPPSRHAELLGATRNRDPLVARHPRRRPRGRPTGMVRLTGAGAVRPGRAAARRGSEARSGPSGGIPRRAADGYPIRPCWATATWPVRRVR